MASPALADPRSRLLAAAVGYLQQHGLGDLSLRELAAAIGTSHRMLIYHFGSKEGLLVAVVHAVEAEQRDFLVGLADDPAIGPIEAMRAMWRRLADPGLWPSERLFFEIYAQALQGRGPAADLLPELVHVWLPSLRELSIRLGVPEHEADAHARLMLAVARGLLLDLVGTGERRAVDRAMELFNRMTAADF